MATLGNRVTTTTRFKLMPFVVDTVLKSNVFFTRTVSRAKKWSGNQMKYPVKVSKNSTGTSFAGMDTFSTSATNNRQLLAFDPAFYQISVALPLDELSANATDDQIIDLAAIEVKGAAQDMADSVGGLFYLDGTGNGNKDPLGLAAIVDDGTSVATFGGLSRTTFPTIKATKTASGGTLSLPKMATLYNAVTSGTIKPTVGVTDPATWALYEQLLQPQERINKTPANMKNDNKGLNSQSGFIGGTGFTGLDYKGFAILADEKCTVGNLYFLNENFIEWRALPMAMTEAIKYKSVDIEGNDYSNVLGLGFSWSGWIKPSDAAAVVGHIYLGGELCCDNPLRQGVLTGVTGV